MSAETPPRCHKCGSDESIPIAYGYPSDQMWEAAARKEIVLGGCVIMADQPTRQCLRCAHQFNEVAES